MEKRVLKMECDLLNDDKILNHETEKNQDDNYDKPENLKNRVDPHKLANGMK